MKHRAASLRQHICLYLNDLFSVIILSLILIKLGVNDMKARAVCIVKPAETAVASTTDDSVQHPLHESGDQILYALYALRVIVVFVSVCLFVCLPV